MKKIDKYILYEMTKGSLLIFFIFISISWLLQFTRLISLSNLIQVDIFTILNLSLFLIPNLTAIILPFVLIFGLTITFLKLYRDREIISIFTLGLSLKSLKKALILFTLINILLLIIFNFYFSPNIYKIYKQKEFEIRNKINFEKINISNFIEINKNTLLDFKRKNNNFIEVFIKFNDKNENIIYAKEADIYQKNKTFDFILRDGFKLTLIEDNKIEKLEFDNYSLKIEDSNYETFNSYNLNSFDIFDDIKNNNYVNIFNKTLDSIIILIIILIFYFNNLKRYKFTLKNIVYFIVISNIILITNQILKNYNFDYLNYIIFFIFLFVSVSFSFFIDKIYAKN